MMEQYPESHDKVEAMLQYLWDAEGSDLMPYEDTHHFVEAATFADDIKYHGHAWQSDYHFLQQPWIEEGEASDYELPTKTRYLTNAIPNLVAMIGEKDGTDYLSSQIYTSINGYYPDNSNLAKSFALRLLIHYVGDIHQPLHCEDRFNKENTTGDKGANTFPLENHRGVDEMHALWDAILWEGYPHQDRPFTDASYDAFQTKVTDMVNRNKRHIPSKLYSIGNELSWSKDSYDIAITLYDGLTENEAVPQAYLDKNIPIAEAQLVKGGYRLAFVLDHIFSTSNESEDVAKSIAEYLALILQ